MCWCQVCSVYLVVAASIDVWQGNCRQAAEPMALLDAILDGLVDSVSGSLRSLCANLCAEWLHWSDKHVRILSDLLYP